MLGISAPNVIINAAASRKLQSANTREPGHTTRKDSAENATLKFIINAGSRRKSKLKKTYRHHTHLQTLFRTMNQRMSLKKSSLNKGVLP
jgi:hypothetical protein